MREALIHIPVEKCRLTAELPEYAKDGDAGADIYAADEVAVKPGETVVVSTGLKVAVPPGWEIQIRPRSGLSLKTGLRVANSPGTIDAGYRGEIGVILTNTSDELIIVKYHSRIAQMVLSPVWKIEWEVVHSVSDIGKDRGGGYGSTGGLGNG